MITKNNFCCLWQLKYCIIWKWGNASITNQCLLTTRHSQKSRAVINQSVPQLPTSYSHFCCFWSLAFSGMTQCKHHKSTSVDYQTQSEITSHHQPVCAPTTNLPLSLQSSVSRYHLPSLTSATFGRWSMISPGCCIVQASLIHVCGLPACLLLLLSMVTVKVQHLDLRHSKHLLTTVRRRCLVPLLMLTAQV